jgi:hypothetical protein
LERRAELRSKRAVKKFETVLWVSVVALGFGAVLQAGETRVWSSRKGTTLEGALLKADATTATLADKAGKEIAVKIEDLSIGDRQFLVENAQVDPKILTIGEPGEPEKEYHLEEKTFVKLKDKAEFGAAKFDLMQTDHFVIAYAGDVRPNIYGEAAERLWEGMAFQHMDFRKDWGDKRMMIVIAQDLKTHQAAGQWYFQALKDAGKADQAGKLATGWEDGGSKGLQLPAAEAEKYGVISYDCYFYLPNQANFKKAMTPKLVHYLASHLIRYATGPVKQKGTYAFYNGHAFYKENELTGEIQTGLGETAGTDLYKKEHKDGFKDKWAAELKKLVKKGDVKVDLTATLDMDFKDGTPANMALMYAFSYYMQSSNLRLTEYDRLVKEIAAHHKMLEPVEIAKIYGFDSVEAFNADWTQFILGGDFK